ncbi:MAG: polysaccharide biosynthesis/export family protein [Acidobacteriota bacterium]
MKKNLLLVAFLLAVPTLGHAQTPITDRRSVSPGTLPTPEPTAVRKRVVGANREGNQAEKQNPNKAEQKAPAVSEKDPQTAKLSNQTSAEPKWGNTAVINRPVASEKTLSAPASTSNPTNNNLAVDRTNKPVTRLVQQTAMITETKSAPTPRKSSDAAARTPVPVRAALATTVYHVGIGDVLDIRLANLPTRESTLFTVLKNGALEYPLLNGPISVAGLTTQEIADLLSSEIKVIRSARVSVTVRDFASHAVLVSGLVDSPGRKILRREALPLYAVLAEALPRAEATVVTILRGSKIETVAINNEAQMAMLIVSGDQIKVSGNGVSARGFVYIGGDVASPGEKEFREGMTLTQALISAGGVSRSAKIVVKLARRNAGGFLTASEFNVQSIQDGKTQDPLLQAGDRIEVIRNL